jgi:hypothetical protein
MQTSTNVIEKTAEVSAVKMESAMLSEIPFLAQNFRPFRSISFVLEEEILGENGTWNLNRKERAKLDFEHDRYSNYFIKKKEWAKQEFWHEQQIQLGEKRFTLEFSTRAGDFTALSSMEKKHAYGRVDLSKDNRKPFRNRSFFSCFYYLSGYNPRLWMSGKDVWIDSFLREPTTAVKFETSRNESSGEIYIDFAVKRFVVDPKRGVVTKIMSHYCDPKIDKMVQEPWLEVTKFHEKEGYLFPIEIILYDDNGKPCSRQRIDPSTLEINKEYSITDFVLKIPAGTRMDDRVKGVSYVAERPLTSQDIKEIESELLALVKKAKNDTQPKSTVK